MNKKIKIIDLLNMQYKNEKMPKNIRIKYSLVFDYYIYNEEMKWYETADKTSILDVFQKLNYEVEILEDNTEEIEEIPQYRIDNCTDYNYCYLAEKYNKLAKAVNAIRKDKNIK